MSAIEWFHAPSHVLCLYSPASRSTMPTHCDSKRVAGSRNVTTSFTLGNMSITRLGTAGTRT
jgi:hypothetical protein